MAESVQAIPSFIDPGALARSALRPTAREWFRHSILFVLTIVSTTIAGIMFADQANPEVQLADPGSWIDYLLYIPRYYVLAVASLLDTAIHNPHILAQGLTFSASLLSILLAHEMGHYVACRRYGVSATLPFFIPAPPLFIAGTFGAFIKIRSPIPTRRALFDIGLAGPLAGFVVLIPLSLIGVLTIQSPLPHGGPGIIFNDPLLFRFLARAVGVTLDP